jgi:cell division septation protein DedD
MAVKRITTVHSVGAFLAAAALLSGCDENGQLFLKALQTSPDTTVTPATTARLVERDFEAPDVFQVTETGLWDGRPSLGGVWVAHPDVKDPERVIIRNQANGKFVIGALFRRERDNPGPSLQLSSDAADAIGVLAGQPVPLNVTAFRREAVEEPTQTTPAQTAIEKPAAVEAQPLDDVVTTAANAIDASTAQPPAAKPTPRPVVSTLNKPFIQIGIFNVEQNAKNTAEAMRQAGIIPQVLQGTSNDKTFWRVIVGPATSTSERAGLLKKVKSRGFNDAYYVTN